MTKACNKCEKEKELFEFYKDKSNKTDGHYSICKQCKNARTAEWRGSNRKVYNAGMRAYNKKHYSRLRLQRYKLSHDQYLKMLHDQNDRCKLCGKGPVGKRPLAIDHHKDSGSVRGLLCYGCNRAIAILDNPGMLAAALVYLRGV